MTYVHEQLYWNLTDQEELMQTAEKALYFHPPEIH